MSNFTTNFIPKNKYTRKGTLLSGVKKIVIHYTANPGASANNHYLYFGFTLPRLNTQYEAKGEKNKIVYASAHIFIDKKEAINIIPLNEVGFHANDNYDHGYRGIEEISPNANLCTIGVELCIEKDGSFHKDTIERAIKVVAELCKIYKLDKNDIVRHYDITHKPCPLPFINENTSKFIDFKNKVDVILNPPKTVVKEPVKNVPKYPGSLIKEGSRGNNVVLIQKTVGVTSDGIFGPNTKKAVIKFQLKHNLIGDGVVGPKTWAIMFK